MMSQVTKSTVCLIMALFISFVGLQSCFLYSTVGPGYSVSIEVTNSIRPGTENNDFIDIAYIIHFNQLNMLLLVS